MGNATFFFHLECNFFEYGQLSLYTSVSWHNDNSSNFRQHCCLHTAEPSVLLRECHYSWFFTFSFPFLLVTNSCPVHSRMFDTLQRKSDEIFLIFSSLALLFPLTAPCFFASTFRCDCVPHAHPVVPAPHVFPLPVVVRIFFFQFNCFYRLPPLRASPLEYMLQSMDDRIWLWITSPCHSSPHTLGNHLRWSWQYHLCPNLSCNPRRPCVVFHQRLIFFSETNKRLIAFVLHPLIRSKVA